MPQLFDPSKTPQMRVILRGIIKDANAMKESAKAALELLGPDDEEFEAMGGGGPRPPASPL